MTVSFPISLEDFFREIGGFEFTMDVADVRASGETGGGEIITMNVGSRLWSGSVTARLRRTFDADALAAKASRLRQADASFLVTDGRRKGPKYDPTGTILGASAPIISSVSSDNCEISISGLPSGYQLTYGDLVSFQYGANGSYALHRVVDERTATGGGVISDLEVYPPVKSGGSGASLALVNPSCKAIMVPGSFQPQTQRAGLSSGFSFSWRQTLS